ncbi:MAG: hypothetical protein MJZ60_02145 [Bacteroidaceae bacterium]|nr:hypothetical protein [Bacteroidaceae bacterium]
MNRIQNSIKGWWAAMLLVVTMVMPQNATAQTKKIGTIDELKAFIEAVNNNVKTNEQFNAQLTADIDATELGNDVVIGTKDNPYQGTFDGKNYTITVNINMSGNDNIGLFGYISNSSIENLVVSGAITGKSNVGAIVGYSKTDAGKETVIRNCATNATINGSTNVGGIIGEMTGVLPGNVSSGANEKGHVTIDRCAFSGNVEGTSSTAGIVGRILEKNTTTDANVTISNCLTTGTISSKNGGSAGIVAIINSSEVGTGINALAAISSCLSLSETDYAIASNIAYANVENCYYEQEKSNGLFGNNASTTKCDTNSGAKSTTEITSGEIAYILNNGVTDGSQAWYQAIGSDKAPSLVAFKGGTVFAEGEGFGNFCDMHSADDDSTCPVCGTELAAIVKTTDKNYGFETIQEAVNAVVNTTDEGIITLKLLSDGIIQNTISLTKGEVVIDLNGFNITNEQPSQDALCINGAQVTIVDNSKAKNGKLIAAYGNAITFTDGKLTINEGEFNTKKEGSYGLEISATEIDNNIILRGGNYSSIYNAANWSDINLVGNVLYDASEKYLVSIDLEETTNEIDHKVCILLPFNYGDANNDEKYTISDIILLVKALQAEEVVYVHALDANRDGKIDMDDIEAMRENVLNTTY